MESWQAGDGLFCSDLLHILFAALFAGALNNLAHTSPVPARELMFVG